MFEEFKDVAEQFPDPFRLLMRESEVSTNDALIKLGNEGAADGLTLLALEQTQGRGRRGATWFSQTDDALAFSILVRPEEPKALWPRLALAAGVAVAEAAEAYGSPAGIKWPNDVWIAKRKVAGILVEAGKDFAIVGIGINVLTTEFPPEIQDIATSLQLENGSNPKRAEVLASIIQRFALRRNQIDRDFDSLLDAVRQRCVLTDHHVSLTTPSGSKQGTVHGIGSGGELLLQTSDGLESLIQADEVRIVG